MRLFAKRRDREQASKEKLDKALDKVDAAGNVFDDLRELLRKIQVDVHTEARHDSGAGGVTATGRPANGEQQGKETLGRGAK